MAFLSRGRRKVPGNSTDAAGWEGGIGCGEVIPELTGGAGARGPPEPYFPQRVST